jgi:hypothetical protein
MESKFYFPFCFYTSSFQVDFEKSYREIFIRIKNNFQINTFLIFQVIKDLFQLV